MMKIPIGDEIENRQEQCISAMYCDALLSCLQRSGNVPLSVTDSSENDMDELVAS
jgi:hypothetical protein